MRIAAFAVAAAIGTAAGAETPTLENPLAGVLARAEAGYQRMEHEIRDYTCLLTRRELVGGELRGPESFYLKVRHQRTDASGVVEPFSVYLRFLRPAAVKDREVIFVQGRHEGKMIVRNGGNRFAQITTAVPPDSRVAMQENRYPITEVGVQTLTRRLIEVGREKMDDPACQVRVVPGAKINDRPCTLIQVAHAERRPDQTWSLVRLFIDDQLELPVYYAAYDWPRDEGGPPVLLEEYIYTELEFNVGLTDWDFDHRNENYLFLKSFSP
jgi:hypothetical protein